MTLESLRAWSHWLMLSAIALPILGGLSGAARYFVQRRVDVMVDEERRAESGALRSELQSARSKVEELEAHSAPRLLTEQQRVALIQALASAPGQAIVFKVLIGSTEAEQYAEQIREAFVAAGWTPTLERAMFMPAFAGIHVAASGHGLAARVVTAFQMARIPLAQFAISADEVPGDVVWLKVSSKD